MNRLRLEYILILALFFVIQNRALAQVEIFSDDFSSDKNWSGFGDTQNGGWERSNATNGGSAEYGSNNPSSDHSETTDNFIIGTVINGSHANNLNETKWLTSPVINCGNYQDVVLKFWQDAACEPSQWDHIYIQVNDGSDWQTIWQNPNTTYDDDGWVEKTIDVSTWADENENFKIRFGIGSTDNVYRYKGWNIDDFLVLGTESCERPNAPNISTFPPVVLAGEMTTLTGSFSGGTLTWFDDECGGHVFATGATVEVSPLIPTTYYARVDIEGCASYCDTVKVIVAQPCHLEASANGVLDTINICSGDEVDLKGIGSCSYLMDNSFEDGMGVGWESNANPQFDNPCMESFDGTTYLWIGSSSSFPRDLITQEYTVTDECQICFDFVMATQGDGSPCEGPDEMDEGVSLQWSIDGGNNWIDITYFCPDGNEYEENFWVGQDDYGGGAGTAFNTWGNYCFSVPADAVSEQTKFRFHQEQVTSQIYDHWGLDNVEISCPTPSQVVQWSHGPTVLDPLDNTTPTSSTSYKVIIDDGLGFGNADTAEVYVQVLGAPIVTDDNACLAGESVTLSASGSGTLNWYENSTGGSSIHTGSTYTIPNLTESQTFYVAEEGVNFSTINYTFNNSLDGWTVTGCLGNNWYHNGNQLQIDDIEPAMSSKVISPSIDVSNLNGAIDLSIVHKHKIKQKDDALLCYRIDGGNWQYLAIDGATSGSSWIYKDPFNACSNNNNKMSNRGNQPNFVTSNFAIDVSSADELEIAFGYSSKPDYSNNRYWIIDNVSLSGGGVSTCASARAEVHAGISSFYIIENLQSVSCIGNNDGQASALASIDGEGAPMSGIFDYTWSNGQHTSGIDNLSAGSYDVTISDVFGCFKTKTITIPEPTLPTVMANTSGVSGFCNIESPDEWVYIVNEDNTNQIIASVFDASGGNNLFTTESELTLYSEVQYHNEEPYLQRVVRITPSLQGAAEVRIYFTQEEFDALKTADPSITSISQLGVTKCDESGSWNDCIVVENAEFYPSSIGTGYYAELSIASFSTFYIHKYSGFPLPVQLIDFSGHCSNTGANLSWSTASEVNNDYFILERSSDMENFEYVTQIDGNGNSLSLIHI